MSSTIAAKVKSSFLFHIEDISQISAPVFSPPFATSYDTFWQLKFTPISPSYPDFCALFLFAIPNADEKRSPSRWPRRSSASAKIFIRDAEDNSEYGSYTVNTDRFGSRWKGQGSRRICRREWLSGEEIIFGVTLEETELVDNPHDNELPADKFPQDLIEAWHQQLRSSKTADVEFNVNGHKIYAESEILSKRSEYFEHLFSGHWSETKNLTKEVEDSSKEDTQKPPAARAYKYSIDIPDFHHETFLALLRFLYTNQITFDDSDDSQTSSFDIFSIADKYCVTELRDRAKIELCDNLSVNNVSEVLFGGITRWPDLKECLMEYLKENWRKVKQTEEWKTIKDNPIRFENFDDLMTEVMDFIGEESEEGASTCEIHNLNNICDNSGLGKKF
ncbi:hypothetical protein G9A89_016851 [Geosiphon pyriformis]|nr:hypothetical protein G9A89_016851 [Geosiphon pyriformis]